MRHIINLLLAIAVIALSLLLNGNIQLKSLPLPPLAKFLHPREGIWANTTKAATLDETISLAGLSKGAEVIYDSLFVPHIYADNIEDALFLQGYVEAQNRLFQMEFMTRAATGRLSEVIGEKGIPIDKNRNRSMIEDAADSAIESWKNLKEYKLLEKYVEGANAYIKSLSYKDYPYEFKLMNFKPEPWSTKKCALVYKSMADVLAGGNIDIESTNSLAILGRTMFDQLYPEGYDGGYPVIPSENKYAKTTFKPEYKDSVIVKKYPYTNINSPRGVGSNNWAISNKKTASGSTILSNDPHLGLSLPSIWIQEHIVTPQTNAYGVSFPGFPGIMIGFNENIAWGETNVGQDIMDLYEIKWADATKTKYILDGKVKDVKFKIKDIKVKNGEILKDTLKYTDLGLIRWENKDPSIGDIAAHWLAAEPQKDPEFMTFVNAMQCKDYTCFANAIKVFHTPAQNFLFASKTGDIGLHVNGTFPIRNKDDGRFVTSGTTSEVIWKQYIARDENPHILNPKQGYLVSANQRSAGTDYPYYFTGAFFEGSRNRVINDSIKKYNNWSIEKVMKLQGNDFNQYAYEYKPILMAVLKEKYGSDPLYQALAKWDCTYKASSNAPTIYEALFSIIYHNTFEEVTQYKKEYDIHGPEIWRLIQLSNAKVMSKVFDDVRTPSTTESMEDIILASFVQLKLKGEELLKPWGLARPVTINHYTKIPALSATNLALDGTPDAVNAMNDNFGPSWRMIVEFGKELTAYGVYPGGQSGNPLSPHYRDFLDTWANKKYHKLHNPKDKAALKNPLKHQTFTTHE
jgi:penicillin G amidase